VTSRIGTIVVREVREALPATVFFLCLFHMIALTKAVLVSDFSAHALRATVATVGALIVAKSMLIVAKLPIARLFSGRLLLNALWRALLFGVVALLFRFIEELIPLVAKHESLVTATAQLRDEVSWPQFWVFQLWLFGALFLYCLVWDLVRVVGAAKVRAMLWSPAAGVSER
jgi:hypothetical protein